MGRTRKYLYCDVHRKALHKCKDCVCECFPDLVFPLTGKCRPHNKRLIECAFCSHVLYTKAEGQADRDEGFFHTKRWNATLPLVAGASSTDELDMTPLLEFDDDTSTGALLDSFRFTESGKPPPLPTKPLMFLPDHDGTLLPESKRPRITRGELKGTLCADLTLEEYETLVADLVERKVHYTVYKRTNIQTTKVATYDVFTEVEVLHKIWHPGLELTDMPASWSSPSSFKRTESVMDLARAFTMGKRVVAPLTPAKVAAIEEYGKKKTGHVAVVRLISNWYIRFKHALPAINLFRDTVLKLATSGQLMAERTAVAMLIQEAVNTLDLDNPGPGQGAMQPYSPHTPAINRHRAESNVQLSDAPSPSGPRSPPTPDTLVETINRWHCHPRIVDIISKIPFYALLPTYETCGTLRQATVRVSLARGKRSASLVSSSSILLAGKPLPASVVPGMVFTLHGCIREIVTLESRTITFKPATAVCLAQPALRNSLWFRLNPKVADAAVATRHSVGLGFQYQDGDGTKRRMSTVSAMIYNAIICVDNSSV